MVTYAEGRRADAQTTVAADWSGCTAPSYAPLTRAHLREPGAGARGPPARVERAWPAGAGFEATRGRAPDYYRAAGVLSEVEAMRTGDPRTGRTLLDSAIAAGPFKSALPAERPYTDLAARYARLGDAARARGLLTEEAGALDSIQLRDAAADARRRPRGDCLARRKAHRGPCTIPGGICARRHLLCLLCRGDVPGRSMQPVTPTRPPSGAIATWPARAARD